MTCRTNRHHVHFSLIKKYKRRMTSTSWKEKKNVKIMPPRLLPFVTCLKLNIPNQKVSFFVCQATAFNCKKKEVIIKSFSPHNGLKSENIMVWKNSHNNNNNNDKRLNALYADRQLCFSLCALLYYGLKIVIMSHVAAMCTATVPSATSSTHS